MRCLTLEQRRVGGVGERRRDVATVFVVLVSKRTVPRKKFKLSALLALFLCECLEGAERGPNHLQSCKLPCTSSDFSHRTTVPGQTLHTPPQGPPQNSTQLTRVLSLEVVVCLLALGSWKREGPAQIFEEMKESHN